MSAARMLLSQFASYPVAIVLAYLVGMITAFVLMRGQVFGTKGQASEQRDCGVRGGQRTGTSRHSRSASRLRTTFCHGWASIDSETIAHLVGVAVPIVTSYYGHKYWTFI